MVVPRQPRCRTEDPRAFLGVVLARGGHRGGRCASAVSVLTPAVIPVAGLEAGPGHVSARPPTGARAATARRVTTFVGRTVGPRVDTSFSARRRRDLGATSAGRLRAAATAPGATSATVSRGVATASRLTSCSDGGSVWGAERVPAFPIGVVSNGPEGDGSVLGTSNKTTVINRAPAPVPTAVRSSPVAFHARIELERVLRSVSVETPFLLSQKLPRS